MSSNKIKSFIVFIAAILILYFSCIVFNIPHIPNFLIEDEYKSDDLDYQITIVNYKTDDYKVIHYNNDQELVASLITKDNSVVLDKKKINDILYAENVANFIRDEDLDDKYIGVFANLENLENKSKFTHDLIISTAVISTISGLGEYSQLSIVTYSIRIGKQKYKKLITIENVIKNIESVAKRNYNFNTARIDLENAAHYSRTLNYSTNFDIVSKLHENNDEIITDLDSIKKDVSLQITEESYTYIGQFFIDVGNFLISTSEKSPFKWFDVSRNELQKKGDNFTKYGQSWQSEFELFDQNYDYVKKLSSIFVDYNNLAKTQTNNTIQFINEKNEISNLKIIEIENHLETISLFTKLKSMPKWVEIEYYMILAKYVHKNKPLTIEYLCNEANQNIEYIKNK